MKWYDLPLPGLNFGVPLVPPNFAELGGGGGS